MCVYIYIQENKVLIWLIKLKIVKINNIKK